MLAIIVCSFLVGVVVSAGLRLIVAGLLRIMALLMLLVGILSLCQELSLWLALGNMFLVGISASAGYSAGAVGDAYWQKKWHTE